MSKAASPEIITCIYCKQQRPPSREHVLAKSLGGDATRPIDCSECNGRVLSRLNQALAERSLVALSRVSETPPDAFDVQLGGDHFHYDTAHDVYTEVKIVNGVRAVLHPQIHVWQESGQVAVIAADRSGVDALTGFIDERLSAATLRSVHVKVGPPGRCATGRIVLHRDQDAFVRVASAADGPAFFDMLQTAWPKLRAQMTGTGTFVAESVPSPEVEVRMRVRLDDVFRAVAMTAFNVLAMRVGVDLALRPEFDVLREYIVGRDVRRPEHLAPGQVAVDPRFVTMVPVGKPALVPTDRHAVTIVYSRPQLLAYVTLYSDNSFVVRLGAIELAESVLVSHEFSTVRKGNAAIEVECLYERLATR